MDAQSAKNIVQVLAAVLQKLIEANDNHPETGKITKFHALRSPSISVRNYLERIAKYANCSGECFVLALVYIDRLIQRNNFVINSLNVHRILITSVMLAAKFFDDHYYNNTYYAKIGGVPRNEMNLLELEFLFLVNFSLYLGPDEYQKYHTELCSENTRAAMFSGDTGAPNGGGDASGGFHNASGSSSGTGSGTSHTAAAATATSAFCAPAAAAVSSAVETTHDHSYVGTTSAAHDPSFAETTSAAMEVEAEAPTSLSAPMDIESE